MGFEILDLLGLLLLVSILNFLFGSTQFKLYLVWLPSIVLAVIVRWGKRGKPDKYLIHLLKFYLRPGVLSAFPEADRARGRDH